MFATAVRSLSLLLVTLLAACASATSGAESTDPADLVTLRVENNLTPSATVTIFSVVPGGNRRRLGVIGGNSRRELTFAAEQTIAYQFMAEVETAPPVGTSGPVPRGGVGGIPTGTAGRIISDQIELGPGRGAVWNLSSNLVVPR